MDVLQLCLLIILLLMLLYLVKCWHGYLSEQGADLYIAQLMPLPLTISCSSKSRLVLPSWYQLIQVVPDNWPLSGYSIVVSHVAIVNNI